jgi:hypothetical protein
MAARTQKIPNRKGQSLMKLYLAAIVSSCLGLNIAVAAMQGFESRSTMSGNNDRSQGQTMRQQPVGRTAGSSKPSSSSAQSVAEQLRFSPLPPTVFAPSGRLHMVERVGAETTDVSDETSSLCIAILCNGGQSVVVVSTSPMSPYCDLDYLMMPSTSLGAQDLPSNDVTVTNIQDTKNYIGNNNTLQGAAQFDLNGNYTAPLLLAMSEESCFRQSPGRITSPCLSMMGPSFVIVNGGNAMESHVLQTKIQDVVLSLIQQEQCSLQTIPTALVARHVADIVQVPTQSVVDEDHPRMLAVSRMNAPHVHDIMIAIFSSH